ncbi:uncharacterized protein C1orf127 homolog [Spea bombifrons]|uniref:uncharacterized protein C1orf127 homolog n=1 Tax=Spea bombifrons TaxID=233779 RepID=UPI00234B8AEF|nr:uncharacterized protein C1orf127 homolog [Spea bombifrons]
MELWLPKRQMDGLLLWLSKVMRFPVSLSSLDRSNRLLSRCRYLLNTDSDGNLLFRVHYSGCKVQMEKGFHVLDIHIVKKTSGGSGRSDRHTMQCPAMSASLGREAVRCEPHYVQVSRPMPLGNSKNQDPWFLTFRGEFVVSLEDASLFGIEVEMSNFSVTIRGPRGQLLNTREFLDRQTEFLPLWLAHGFYAYSLEASCPLVTRHPGEDVILSIPKQRMGLVKRGSYSTEMLTLRNIVVGQSISATVTENKHFIVINIPAKEVLRTQACRTAAGNVSGVQAFYSVDLRLEFVELAYPMNWTMENYYECTEASQQELTFLSVAGNKPGMAENVSGRAMPNKQDTVSATEGSSHINTSESTLGVYDQPKIVSPKQQASAELDIGASGEDLDVISGSGDYLETQTPSADSATPNSYSNLCASNRLLPMLITRQLKIPNCYKTALPGEKETIISKPKLNLPTSGRSKEMTNIINATSEVTYDHYPKGNQTTTHSSIANATEIMISNSPAINPNATNKGIGQAHLHSPQSDPEVLSKASPWMMEEDASLEVFPVDGQSKLMAEDGFILFVPRNVSTIEKKHESTMGFPKAGVGSTQDETWTAGRPDVLTIPGNDIKSPEHLQNLHERDRSRSYSVPSEYTSRKQSSSATGVWSTKTPLSNNQFEEITNNPPGELEKVVADEQLLPQYSY